ncbi:MAG: hypothetical protein K5848_04520 [Lachnospiraceae bacterium]|nr:hypothetical protein [Lachnospiraceae bacterium]
MAPKKNSNTPKSSSGKNMPMAGSISEQSVLKNFIKKNISAVYGICWAAILFLAVCYFASGYIPKSDFKPMIKWWATLLLLGLTFLPSTLILFKRFRDNGWFFSKTIGLAVSAWVVFYLSSFKLLKFTAGNCITVIVLCFVANVAILFFYNKKSSDPVDFKECLSANRVSRMIIAESVFFAIFTVWCYLKGFNASAYGTEKFMDYGYLTAILKSEYMPANDLWFAGKSINYYYVGQYISAYLIRVSGVGAGYGYNLMMMTLAALTACIPYSIVSNVLRYSMMEKEKSGEGVHKDYIKTVPVVGGIIAGVAVSIAGNMHYPIFKWIMPKIDRMKGREISTYWFSDATRYIGYNPEVDDKTIHEFPSYSFVLGDLHAHVINIIFVLTVIGLLFAWLIKRKAVMDISKTEGAPKIHFIREIFSPQMIMVMFFIGLFHMTNYWDFPIYFVVSGAVILFTNLITYRYKSEAWLLTGFQVVAFVLVGIIVALPFTLSFDSISTSVKFCTQHSRFYQLLILWGLPSILVIFFAASRIMAAFEKKEEQADEKKVNFFVRIFDSVDTAELFTCILGFCAMGLVFLPEVIYVVDIYGGAYQRANTMFKLTYQAFIMFGMCMAVIITRFLYFVCDKKLRVFGKVALVLFIATACYFLEACGAWFSHYYLTLDASAFLENENSADADGIAWINENVPDDAVVLEMCGLSYSYFNRVSVFTGNPTVLGWQTHEWLWRSSGNKDYPPEITERHRDVVSIYTSTSVSEVLSLINKYNIDYIYVGEAEHFDGYISGPESDENTAYFHGGYYSRIRVNDNLLKALGEVIEIAPEGTGSSYATYIVKIDHTKTFTEDYIAPPASNSDGTTDKEDFAFYTYDTPASAEFTGFVMKDFAGNSVAKKEFSYNEYGRVAEENNYDSEGNLVSRSVYTFTEDTLTYKADFLADGTQYGFCEYKEHEGANPVTAHYFYGDISTDADNYEYICTLNSEYNPNGSLSVESISYQEGTLNQNFAYLNIDRYEYTYGAEGVKEMAVYHTDGTADSYAFTYSEDLVMTGANVVLADGSTGTVVFTH